jgi:HEAT repeat protein
VRSAIIGLGLMGARGQLDELAAGIIKVNGTVERASMLHALGIAGDRRMLPVLLEVAADEAQPTYVRTYALQALGELADPRDLSPCWQLSSHVELNHEVGFLFELYRVL